MQNIKWLLTDPQEIEIYKKHLDYYLNQFDIKPDILRLDENESIKIIRDIKDAKYQEGFGEKIEKKARSFIMQANKFNNQIITKMEYVEGTPPFPIDFEFYCENGILYFNFTENIKIPEDIVINYVILYNGNIHEKRFGNIKNIFINYEIQRFGDYRIWISINQGNTYLFSGRTCSLSYIISNATEYINPKNPQYSEAIQRLNKLIVLKTKEDEILKKLSSGYLTDYLILSGNTQIYIYGDI